MGHIYILMGKSATGKDTIYRKLITDPELGLKRIISYTTRPIRPGEQDGREYRFVTRERMEELKAQGRIIESRVYHTVYGDWYYFTADDGQMEDDGENCLMITTLEAYLNIRNYYGAERVVPLYIEVEDGERLIRAIEREKQTGARQYAEMCRRFLADDADFSEEKLAAAGIKKHYQNREINECCGQIKTDIQEKTMQ